MSRSRRATGAVSALLAAALALTGTAAAHAATGSGPVPASAAGAAAAPAVGAGLRAQLAARSRARATGRPVTVDALTTATSVTRANADGSFTTVTSTRPARMRTRSGGWAALDADLRKGPDGRIVTTAAQGTLELSPGGRGPLVSLDDGAGHTLALTLPFALPAPVLSGDTATYRDISPGLDLTVTARTDGGFGEVFTARTAAAARAAGTLTFATGLKGLALRQDAAGNLTAYDSRTGAVVLASPAPAVWDSATDGRADADAPETAPAATAGVAGPGRRSDVAKLPATVTATGITLDSAAARLGHGAPKLPEYIDPTWSLPTATGGEANFTEVQAGCPSYNNYDSSSTAKEGLGVGNVETNSSCPGAYRSFYQDSLGGIGSDDQITHSVVNLSEVYSAQSGCGISEPISLYQTGLMSSPSSWSNQPGKINDIDNFTVATDGGCGVNSYTVDITGAMQALAAGNNTNLTWGLYGNESSSDTLVRFNSNPTITTTYDIKPNTPTATAASPTPVTSSGVNQPCGGSATGYLPMAGTGGTDAATLSATLTSSVPSAQLQGVFTLVDVTAGQTLPTLTSSGWAASGATVQVQTPALTSGHQYSWTVTADDQYDTSAASSACTFTAVQTPPTNPVVSSTDFPPSGSSTGTSKRFQQAGNNSGVLDLSSTDPGGPGVSGFYYSVDTPVPTNGGTFLAATGGAAALTVQPADWGTTTVWVQAADAAGNRSAATPYSFYLPWYPGAKVTFGDLTGDGIPDLLTTGATSGGLLLHPGDADPAAAPTVLSPQADTPDAGTTPWSKYLVTHGGSFSNGPGDDIWAFNTATGNLYLYKNTGAGAFQNPSSAVDLTKAEVTSDSGGTSCFPTSTADCTGYDATDWKNLTQIVAVGDLYTGSSRDVSGTHDIVTVEGDALWLYQGRTGANFLKDPVKLGTSGWSGVTVLGPGLVGGRPVLWARNSAGAITQYPITFDSSGYPESLGTPASGGTPIATGLDPADYPVVTSPGDVLGDGTPGLYAIDKSSKLWFYAGTAGQGGPAPTHQWLLDEGSGSTIDDSAGGLSGYVSEAGATWGTRDGHPDLGFDGDSGYAETNGNAVDTGGSFTVSAWAELTSIPSTGANYTVLSEFGTENSPFYLQYNSGNWAFAISDNDSASPTINGPDGTATVTADTWYHLTGVYDATSRTASVYVDGVLVGSQSGLPTWSSSGDLDIGRDLYTGLQVDYFPGQISDVETWGSALSAAQVAALDAPAGGLAATGSLAGTLAGS
ncbi:LamG domain-containing protein [Streptacidiphilus sp. PB12-B1b]|uniref:LamG-like jellyroll fold domain-containing protein n=1 Tax=Streptacidiphilus sp. PB12-B1b TaxID=2705012 RepID=UPI0015FE021E|nr:LamG-like jellyroll fold domain-containing protein [Streptacidiphilus sp. PB12-B1b]QMU77976.1 LamG domain-containing protein [Streptacidiphilus sp. PB12-B1b]